MNEFEEKIVESTPHGKRSRKFDLIALILCLVIALSVWLYVESINQDIVEKEIIITFDAEKQLYDETFDGSDGMYIFSGNEDIDYSQVEVKLTVSGPEDLLEKYDDDEYVVELDTSGITQAGGRYGVYFKYKLPHEEIQYKSIVATAYTSSLMLVDYKAENKKVPLTADYVDTPAKKESVVVCTPKTEEISISGPASMVDEISSVVATVNVNTLTESTVVKSKSFEFFDKDGSPILLNGSYVTLTPSEVEVDVTIDYVNEPVEIQYDFKIPEGETHVYEVSLTFENGTPVILNFNGNSLQFPDSGKIVWHFGDISEHPEEKSIKVSEFINDPVFDEYREYLELSNSADGDRVIIIKVTKNIPTSSENTDNTDADSSPEYDSEDTTEQS